jgi:hypothetical protein
MKLLLDMKLSSWLGEGPSSKSLREMVVKINPSFFQRLNAPGTTFINAYGIPEMSSIKSIYSMRFGIPLCAAYCHAMTERSASGGVAGTGTGEGHDDQAGNEAFMELYIALLHVLGCSVQIILALKDKKIRSCMPSWFEDEMVKLFSTNNPTLLPSSNSATPHLQLALPWSNIADVAVWDFDFGLKEFASSHVKQATASSEATAPKRNGGKDASAGFCTSGFPSMVCMRIKAARSDLSSLRYVKGKDDVMMVERYMSSLCSGMSCSVMAKMCGMRITGDRKKRKSSDADGTDESD